MRIVPLCCALCIFSFFPASVEAQSASWTCNAGAGKFARNGLDTSAGLAVSGTIEFKDRHGGSKWASRAAVNFRRARGEEKFGGLGFYFAHPDDKALTVDLVGFDGGRPQPIGQITLGRPVSFTVRIDADGNVTANLGGKTVVAKGRSFSGGITQASCSSAEVEFAGLNVPVIIY